MKSKKRNQPEAAPEGAPKTHLELTWKTPENETRRVLMLWDGRANDITLAAWIDAYNAAVGPGGSCRRVYDELGYQPVPTEARIVRGSRKLASWPSNVVAMRRTA